MPFCWPESMRSFMCSVQFQRLFKTVILLEFFHILFADGFLLTGGEDV